MSIKIGVLVATLVYLSSASSAYAWSIGTVGGQTGYMIVCNDNSMHSLLSWPTQAQGDATCVNHGGIVISGGNPKPSTSSAEAQRLEVHPQGGNWKLRCRNGETKYFGSFPSEADVLSFCNSRGGISSVSHEPKINRENVRPELPISPKPAPKSRP